MVCAAMAGSASLAAAAIPGGIASAVPLTVSCTTLSSTSPTATSNSTGTISGCSGTGANSTNAGVAPAHGTDVSNLSTKKATITWSNGKKTVSSFTYTSLTNNCVAPAGYTNLAKVHETGKVLPSTSGTTTAGMVGGLTSATVCAFKKTVGGSILVKNYPGTKVVI